jgi:hypothetical protein
LRECHWLFGLVPLSWLPPNSRYSLPASFPALHDIWLL